MVHDQVDVPLRKELKTGSFWQNHPEHRVDLFQSAFLTALHRVTIINAGTLDSGIPVSKVSGSPNSEPRSVRIYSNIETNS